MKTKITPHILESIIDIVKESVFSKKNKQKSPALNFSVLYGI
ncbi:hypothetical protein CUZ89_1820 [Enterococcus xinjiangensis]|uniref:Uncharacterized protein n=1 Tax=Enterococcus faecium SD2A-2 TaxID=1244154 RepID=A0AB73A5R5_ENTFC|nr:hypothetical protein D356_02748 [Enterococcus faecium SD2A-2]KXA08632.1 hypothetical protein HMPREF3199_01388 [Enterococcus faecium]MBL4989247.1 hypothetical protein [Enterococcus lactis]MBL4992020.1 hypothetical protein [Enterococcus lactis]MBL5003637.1 hypothetical protein [Enterococcus lactis]